MACAPAPTDERIHLWHTPAQGALQLTGADLQVTGLGDAPRPLEAGDLDGDGLDDLWVLDAEGFQGDHYRFRWKDVRQVDFYLADPAEAGETEWLNAAVHFEGPAIASLHPNDLDKARALASCVPKEARRVY